MKDWTLREHAILALIIANGHKLAPDEDKGWVKCSRCTDGWWVSKRAQIADDPSIKMPLIDGDEHIDPFDIGVCQS